MKLKKLHKMGDVENTILKYFEKEKNRFVRSDLIFLVFLASNIYCLKNIRFIKLKII
ncbi:hypothetical protein MY1_0198 [Nitrosarchaeum koreense MY1]|uniref:Uncharacterized protein n=1 Tax=Nitrosarchaeum koreense MY1 TaxID=1001994 RepID=F9CZ11_9ARCH|nr:hypothetical protein MY1_0198 [Nitrosarchaeum koreense MY1]